MARYRDPFTGHFISADAFAKQLAALDKALAKAERDLQRKRGKVGAKALRTANDRRDAARAALRRFKTGKPKPAPKSRPPKPRSKPQPAPSSPRIEAPVVEWEFGIDYVARRNYHSVTVNIRVRRTDGQAMPKALAMEVYRFMRSTGEVPDGITLLGIDWSHPKQRDARYGSSLDLPAFVSMMRAVPLVETRAGRVK